MSKDQSTWPWLFEIFDKAGVRITTTVAHSTAQARKDAQSLFGDKLGEVRWTKQRAKPRKCCDDCPDDKPCGGSTSHE